MNHFRMRTSGRGFTLVELLVVIGIIGALAAGMGLMLKGGNPAAGLRAGQGNISSLLSSVRGQAALNQVNAMLIVDADDTKPETFLKSIKIVISTGTNTWKEVGTEILLPNGVYVVPQSSGVATLANSSRLSDFFDSAGAVSGVTGVKFLRSKQYTPLGAVVDSGGTVSGGRIMVAAGTRLSETELSIDNEHAVRGVIVSNYGVPRFANEGETLD